VKFIHSIDPKEGFASLASRISSVLNSNKPVLWLVCGGSNVPVAFDAFKSIKAQVASRSLSLLTIGQTDERYGPIGHVDSNWQQLIEAGFDFKSLKSLPILIGKPLDQTVSAYSNAIEVAIADVKGSNGLIVALFGIGPDGHIAGLLPHSPAVDSTEPVCGYEAGKFTRVTLTPIALKKTDVAYVFAFGESKKEALTNLQEKELSLDDQPAQILKELKEVFVYSDQV